MDELRERLRAMLVEAAREEIQSIDYRWHRGHVKGLAEAVAEACGTDWRAESKWAWEEARK